MEYLRDSAIVAALVSSVVALLGVIVGSRLSASLGAKQRQKEALQNSRLEIYAELLHEIDTLKLAHRKIGSSTFQVDLRTAPAGLPIM
jgi:hypothetical protein